MFIKNILLAFFSFASLFAGCCFAASATPTLDSFQPGTHQSVIDEAVSQCKDCIVVLNQRNQCIVSGNHLKSVTTSIFNFSDDILTSANHLVYDADAIMSLQKTLEEKGAHKVNEGATTVWYVGQNVWRITPESKAKGTRVEVTRNFEDRF